jgi:hypothetical protein
VPSTSAVLRAFRPDPAVCDIRSQASSLWLACARSSAGGWRNQSQTHGIIPSECARLVCLCPPRIPLQARTSRDRPVPAGGLVLFTSVPRQQSVPLPAVENMFQPASPTFGDNGSSRQVIDAKQRREHHWRCMTPRSRRTSKEPPRPATGVALFISRCHLKPRNEIDLDHCPDADRGDRYRHLCRGAQLPLPKSVRPVFASGGYCVAGEDTRTLDDVGAFGSPEGTKVPSGEYKIAD